MMVMTAMKGYPAMADAPSLTFAIPKGRLAKDVAPLLAAAGIEPEAAFFDDKDRRLIFSSNVPGLRIVPVKPFDVPTFVALGGADFGIAGADVIHEFDYREVFAPVDLGIGYCRLSVALPDERVGKVDVSRLSHLKVATKYPNLTRKHYAEQGIQAECIKLNGSIELAPKLGLTDRIVDIVTTGNTLRANGLTEVETIIEITSRLIVNRSLAKTQGGLVNQWVQRFSDAVLSQQQEAA